MNAIRTSTAFFPLSPETDGCCEKTDRVLLISRTRIACIGGCVVSRFRKRERNSLGHPNGDGFAIKFSRLVSNPINS